MPKPTEFSVEQYNEAYPDGIEFHFWNLGRNQIIESLLKRYHNPQSAVLDIGCGRGITVEYLRDRGLDAFGVEKANAVLPKKAKEYIFDGCDFTDVPNEVVSTVTTILLLDVLEHLEDPQDFLKKIFSHFTSLNYVVVTLPARKELWSNYDVHYGHFSRYDRNDLFELAHSVNKKIVKWTYFFHLLYLPLALSVLRKKNRNIEVLPPKEIWLHSILAWLFFFEYKITPKRLFGSSILGVLEIKRIK